MKKAHNLPQETIAEYFNAQFKNRKKIMSDFFSVIAALQF